MLHRYILRFVILLLVNTITGILIAIEESNSSWQDFAMYIIVAVWTSVVFAFLITLARKAFKQLWKAMLSLIILCVSELSLWVLAIKDVLGVDPVVVSTGIASLKFGISILWVTLKMFRLLWHVFNFLSWVPHDWVILIIILSLIGAFYITALLSLVEGVIYLFVINK
ncbi:MAG: hypothetical protein GXO48_05215 [Chlorobi bacterium]|nr:hypothetical protein [Chlorobiota bacterium]